MANRTDIHRKGAVIASDYEYVLSYSLATSQGGWPVPSYRVNCLLDRRTKDHVPTEHDANGTCCILGMREKGKLFAKHGNTGKCTICGAAFIYGDVWVHTKTGEHIHVGHDCADKYQMIADRSEFDGLRASFAEVAIKASEIQHFLDTHEGLADALKGDHNILRDLSSKLHQWRYLSDKQVALALKIFSEMNDPNRQVETLVPAPTEGRIDISGEIVSVKQTDWGTRMTIKVKTPAGAWLAWGNVPKGLVPQRGQSVTIRATAEAGREAHFCKYSRPMLIKGE